MALLLDDASNARGEVAVVGRREGSQRVWDIADRWYPETEKGVTGRRRSEIIEGIASRALGVKLKKGAARSRTGTPSTSPCRRADDLLSPFDRLIHDRDRAEALWDFYYRLEMYVPAAKREYGYYVLPILRGDRIVGRIEPVHDRKAGELRVRGVWWEDGVRPVSLDRPLRSLARWLGATHRLMDFETRAIHEGQEPDPATGAVTVPIYQTSTYVQEAVGEHKGYDYSRTANPTRRALEICLASLESAEYGFAFSSGMGATTTIMHLVSPGDRSSPSTTSTAARTGSSRKVYEPKGYEFEFAAARRDRRGDRRAHAPRLAGDADEPAAEHRRHPRRRRCRARSRGGRRRRQHVRDAVPPAAARARRRHRRPLDDEVPRRPLRPRRRLRLHERPDDRRAPRLPPELARRRARARSTAGSSCAG